MSVVEYKAQADRLAKYLASVHGVKLKHTASLEAVAAVHNAKSWNVLQASRETHLQVPMAPASSPQPGAASEHVHLVQDPRLRTVQQAVYDELSRESTNKSKPLVIYSGVGQDTRLGFSFPLPVFRSHIAGGVPLGESGIAPKVASAEHLFNFFCNILDI